MSSGCGDVVSLESMQIARKHQIFEIEVITGKSGGVAGGADIDYATNQVTGQTQKTLPAVLRDAGFSPVSWDFSTGGTLTTADRDKVVYDPVSKTWYSYAGALPVTIPAGFNPVGNADWKPLTDPDLRNDLTTKGLLDPQYVATFPTVDAMRTYGNHLVGNVVRTMGYYASGDGGGATYVITAGSPLGDFSDAGSVVISGSLFAKLAQQTSFDLRQFGVKHSASDPTTLAANDTGIAAAMLRGRFGFAKILINGVIYHKKPIVVDYYQNIEGVAIGSDPSYTPRFIKVDNTTSGIAPLAYPGSSDSVIFDVDAGIIVKRQNANTDFARGITLKGFLLQSLAKSSFAIYAPHMADFNINVDSRGFNGGIRFFVNFLGRYEGRHIGLGSEASDPTLAIGVWASHFSTTLDCGNSVTFRLSLNGYNRGMQGEYFANAVLERVTMENIKKPTPGSPTSSALLFTESTLSGQLSCESSATCILRAGANAVYDITLSAVFHVTQGDASEGIIHVLNGGRINLRPSVITADAAGTKIIQEPGGHLDIASGTRMANVSITAPDGYRFKDRTASAGIISSTTATSFASGTEVTFTLLSGLPKATLSGGTIQFTSPGLVKITVQGRNISAGSVTFGVNGVMSETVSNGMDRSMIVNTATGDVLNIKAVGELTLGSNGGIRVLIEPCN